MTRLFLDSSVLLAACGSDRGASHAVTQLAPRAELVLLATPYVVEEVLTNLPTLGAQAAAHWARIRPQLVLMEDVLTLDRVSVFAPAKDRPVLFSALAWSDVLLTLVRADFGGLIGNEFYGLRVMTPAMFLRDLAPHPE